MNEPLDTQGLIRAIIAWAKSLPHGWRASGSPSGYSYIQLHTRPDPRAPEVQLTLRAALVDGMPVIQVDGHAPSPSVAASGEQASPQTHHYVLPPSTAHDPNAICEGCSAVGTIGRATRSDPTTGTTETHQFCMACWPEQSARYRARWNEEDRLWTDRFFRKLVPARGAGPSMGFEAPTWHASLEMVRQIERSMMAPPIHPSVQDLERVAAELQRVAPQLIGEMPFAVESFIRRYSAPT